MAQGHPSGQLLAALAAPRITCYPANQTNELPTVTGLVVWYRTHSWHTSSWLNISSLSSSHPPAVQHWSPGCGVGGAGRPEGGGVGRRAAGWQLCGGWAAACCRCLNAQGATDQSAVGVGYWCISSLSGLGSVYTTRCKTPTSLASLLHAGVALGKCIEYGYTSADQIAKQLQSSAKTV